MSEASERVDLVASGIVKITPVNQPLILTEFPLEGEGADRAFTTPSGMRIRARVRVSARETVRPPEGVDPSLLAPTRLTLTLSIARLEADNSVAKAGDQFLISDVHEISITDAQFSEDFELESEIMRCLGEMADRMERSTLNKTSAMQHLNRSWGVTIPDTLNSFKGD